MRDVDYVMGLGRFGWSWDGTNIIRLEPQTGNKLVFHPSTNNPVEVNH
jgi:hypothetical protein